MLAKLGKIIVVSCLSSLVLFSSIARADDKTAFDCTLTNKVDGSKMDTFTPDTKTIYLLCQSGTVKKGESYKAVWIATDTNNVVPANYKIDEKGVGVEIIYQGKTPLLWAVEHQKTAVVELLINKKHKSNCKQVCAENSIFASSLRLASKNHLWLGFY